MSDNDDERQQRRRNRRKQRRLKTASATSDVPPFTDIFDIHRYVNKLVQRLERSGFIPGVIDPLVATQTRHVNNYQHSIPFRQQFVEQIAADIEYMDRKIHAYYQKHAKLQDKQHGVIMTQLEEVYIKKEKEMELLNHRDVVRKLLENHLKNSTPEGQLRRIMALEEALETLRGEHNVLNQRVQTNENECLRTKEDHHRRIENLTSIFSELRIEINEYKQTINKEMEEIRRRLKTLEDQQKILEENQNKNESSMKKLRDEIEQLIKDRRQDVEKLNQLSKRLETLNEFFNRMEEKMILVDQIPSIVEELEKIRFSLIPPERIDQMEKRLEQIESIFDRHERQFEELERKFTRLDSLLNQLEKRIDRMENEHLTKIDELRRNVEKISDEVKNISDEMKRLTEGFLSLDDRLTEVEKKIKEIDEIKLKLKEFESMEKTINDLAERLKQLEERLNNLPPPSQPADLQGLKDLQKSIQSILDLLNGIRQDFTEKINETKSLLAELQKRLNELFSLIPPKPSSPLPPIVPEKIRTSKRFLFKEPLKSRDLFENLWDDEMNFV